MNFSTFAAISELFVTLGVLHVVYHNYKQLGYKWSLALGLMIFEFSVNMLYMISRLGHHAESTLSSGSKILAALHGSLSLIVFILLVVFSLLARQAFAQGKFYYHDHKVLTAVFVVLWLASVGSGEVLYFLAN